MPNTHLLFPSAVVCSCGKRFESITDDDSSFASSPVVDNNNKSALWLFLQHCAQRAAAHRWQTFEHCPVKVLLCCVFCKRSVDVNHYRQHLSNDSCDGDVSRAIATLAKVLDDESRERIPSFLCGRQRNRTICQHLAGSGCSHCDLCIHCRACQWHEALGDAVEHAVVEHSHSVVGQSADALADLFYTWPTATGRRQSSIAVQSPTDSPHPVADDSNSEAGCPQPPETTSRLKRQPSLDSADFDLQSEPTTTSERVDDKRTHQGSSSTDINSQWHPDDDDSYRCDVCQKSLGARAKLRNHLLAHIGKSPYGCAQCGKQFLSLHHLRGHELTHNFVGDRHPHKCEHCSMAFGKHHRLRKHAKKVHQIDIAPMTYRFSCAHCLARFHQQFELDEHQRRHLYTCDHCTFTSTTSAGLWHHVTNRHDRRQTVADMTTDSGATDDNPLSEKPDPAVLEIVRRQLASLLSSVASLVVECENCGRRVKGGRHYRLHCLVHLGAKPFRCEKCGKAYFRPASLSAHQSDKHGTQRFECEECGKRFNSAMALSRHLSVHRGTFRYRCRHCEASFPYRLDYRAHLRWHNGKTKKLHSCDYCVRECRSRTQLKAHLEMHVRRDGLRIPGIDPAKVRPPTPSVRAQCPECGRVLSCMQAMRQHLWSQHGIGEEVVRRRPPRISSARCAECDKAFLTRREMQIHARTHVQPGNKLYSCEFCAVEFSAMTGLLKHSQTLSHLRMCELAAAKSTE